jgi:hypothetical protein
MSFVNTVDIIGDEALTNSILNGSITEIADNRVTSVGDSAFRGCSALIRADFPSVTGIYNTAFYDCSVLATLILRSETMCTLYYTGSFDGSPIAAGTGYIYVPSALYDSYLADSKWSTHANQFRKLEDYTVDGTVTGEVDPTRCRVRFFNEDGTFLGYVIVPNGGNAVYPGDEPVKEGDYAFTGWKPSPTNVKADMDCYAQFKSTNFDFSTTDFSQGYSVEWDYTKSSPALTRIGLSAGLSDPAPATSLTAAGSSPFDNVMPWAGMKKYNIIDGAMVSEDDAGFSMTDYDTVVYIPEFYYAAYKDTASSKWRWSISPTEKEGYVLHPGSGRYVGRYYTSGDSTEVFTKSGTAPLSAITRAEFRTYSHNKGANWWMLDLATWSALQLLFLVEFANFNSQGKLGDGTGKYLAVGNITGKSDTSVYHTYKYEYTNQVLQYRWVEALWGHARAIVDGFAMTKHYPSGDYLIGTNNSMFDEDRNKLTNSGITSPSTTGGYISGFGYSNKFPWAFLPDTAAGSLDTYVPDKYIAESAYIAAVGCHGDETYSGGLFSIGFYEIDKKSGLQSSRLIYIP